MSKKMYRIFILADCQIRGRTEGRTTTGDPPWESVRIRDIEAEPTHEHWDFDFFMNAEIDNQFKNKISKRDGRKA